MKIVIMFSFFGCLRSFVFRKAFTQNLFQNTVNLKGQFSTQMIERELILNYERFMTQDLKIQRFHIGFGSKFLCRHVLDQSLLGCPPNPTTYRTKNFGFRLLAQPHRTFLQNQQPLDIFVLYQIESIPRTIIQTEH